MDITISRQGYLDKYIEAELLVDYKPCDILRHKAPVEQVVFTICCAETGESLEAVSLSYESAKEFYEAMKEMF